MKNNIIFQRPDEVRKNNELYAPAVQSPLFNRDLKFWSHVMETNFYPSQIPNFQTKVPSHE